MSQLDAVARDVVARARASGADEASAWMSRSVTSEVEWRDGRLEKVQESRALSLQVSLLVEERYSVYATNDLRPEALDHFLARAVVATRALEPDPDRRLPDLAGMGVSKADLDVVDREPLPLASRLREDAAALERQAREVAGDAPLCSIGVGVWTSDKASTMVCSNGFSGQHAGTRHGLSLWLTLNDEGGRKPEGYLSWVARHRADLPPPELAAREAVSLSLRRLASRPAKSGRYPMLIRNHRVPRVLNLLLAPLMGQALHEGRSCFSGAIGQKLSPAGFTLADDPLLARGPHSRPFDGDGLPSRVLPLFQDGVLSNMLLDVYYARRLGLQPTTGGTSNLVIPAGDRSTDALLAELPQAIVVEGFLGGNSNSATGSFSLGVSGVLYERGEPVQNVSEMNISGSLAELLERWVLATNDPWRYGSVRSPSLLFDAIQFSGA